MAGRRKEEERMAERKIIAVGAIILSEDGKILIAQETKDKPVIDKKAGDWSFPAETMKDGETIEEGLKRLFQEEVGRIEVDYDLLSDWIGDYNAGNERTPLWARVFLVRCREKSDTEVSFGSIDGEVINHRWVSPEEILSMPRRKCVAEPIKDFIDDRRGVICEKCLPGAR